MKLIFIYGYSRYIYLVNNDKLVIDVNTYVLDFI